MEETNIDAKSVSLRQDKYEKPNVEQVANRWKIQDYQLFKGKFPGKFIIFNHDKFDKELGLSERHGTDEDANRIKITFEKLGFQEADKCQENLTCDEIIKKLDEVLSESFEDYGSIVIAILTHGDLGQLYAKDVQYKVTQLWDVLTSKKIAQNLAGKPKLFLLQACQGEVADEGLEIAEPDAKPAAAEIIEEQNIFRIPLFADFLLVFSSAPGFVSFRTSTGSWFIQCLCDAIEQFKESMDLESILTLVKYDVAVNKESYSPNSLEYHKMKQIPAVSSTLMKKLYLTKKAMDQTQKPIILCMKNLLPAKTASESEQPVDSKPVVSRKLSTIEYTTNSDHDSAIKAPEPMLVSPERTLRDRSLLWFMICIIFTFLATCYILSKIQPVNHFHCYQNNESEVLSDKVEL